MKVRRGKSGLRYIRLGEGTTVSCGAPVVEVVDAKGKHGARVVISQRISLSVAVTVAVSKDDHCGLCGAAPPLPDADGAAFILANNDGDRLVFPREAGCREERDCYPVTGWETVDVDDDEKPLCPECARAIAKATGAAVERIRKRGSDR